MKLNYKRTIFVGFAFFLISAFWQAYDTLVPKMLTDRFGMSQMGSGVIMALDNIFALFLLPFFGALSDKSKSKHGRRTPFIVVGTLIAAAMLVVMTLADTAQLARLEPIRKVDDVAALSVLYNDEACQEVKIDGKTISQIMSEEDFCAIRSDDETHLSKDDDRTAYTAYVIPLRQAYAAKVTRQNPGALFAFIAILLVALVAMGVFRSPAVALMPDVTIKPLRSKANAVINLMGSAGGVLILVMGKIFGTGAVKNVLMSYTTFFLLVAGVMLAALCIFLWRVKEVRFAAEMEEESRRLGLDASYDEQEEEKSKSGARKLSRSELRSLLLILTSVVFWFFGYNAVTSKYSVYAGEVLKLDYNMTLIIAQAAAIVAYLPIGLISAKLGRKKVILGGIVLLGSAFLGASFMGAGSSILVMDVLFIMAGIGWAAINVNSYPMVVQLASGSDVGKYTGYYYTASMAAQTATPIISGFFMDWLGKRTLFPYGAFFVFLAILTISLVKHGDAKPEEEKAA